jgi:hypothetical protein
MRKITSNAGITPTVLSCSLFWLLAVRLTGNHLASLKNYNHPQQSGQTTRAYCPGQACEEIFFIKDSIRYKAGNSSRAGFLGKN